PYSSLRHGLRLDFHSFPTRRSSDLCSALLTAFAGNRRRRADLRYLHSLGMWRRRTQRGAPSYSERERTTSRKRRSYWPLAYMSRSEEHTSELQSRVDLVCRLLLEKK